MRIQLKFFLSLPSDAHTQSSLSNPPLHSVRNPKLHAVHNLRHRQQQLRHRHIPRRTHPRSNQERRKRFARRIDVFLRIALAGDPPLRRELERLREVRGIVVQSVEPRADKGAGWDVFAVDLRTAGLHDAPWSGADGRAEAQRFVDAGAEVGA